jgi:hypothetical protein
MAAQVAEIKVFFCIELRKFLMQELKLEIYDRFKYLKLFIKFSFERWIT